MKETNTKSIKKFGLITGVIMLAGVIGFSLVQKNDTNQIAEAISTISTTASLAAVSNTTSIQTAQESTTSVTSVSLSSAINNLTTNSKISMTSSNNSDNGDLVSLPKNSANTAYQYKIKEGDMFWCLAEKYYGSAYNWVDLMNANNFSDEKQYYLYVDEVVSFPEVSKVQSFEKTNFCK